MYRSDLVLRGRHKVKMKLTYSNKDHALQSPYYQILAISLWNQLEFDVHNFASLAEFIDNV